MTFCYLIGSPGAPGSDGRAGNPGAVGLKGEPGPQGSQVRILINRFEITLKAHYLGIGWFPWKQRSKG